MIRAACEKLTLLPDSVDAGRALPGKYNDPYGGEARRFCGGTAVDGGGRACHARG